MTGFDSSLIPKSGIEGLIFDLDGTLADTMPLHIKAWIEMGQSLGVNITEQMIIDRAGTPTLQVVDQFNQLYGWDIDPTMFRKRKNTIYRQLKTESGAIQPVKQVVDLARSYKDMLPMSIGTGSVKENALMALEDLGIASWFEGMVTAEDVEMHKPHPDTFLACAELMNVKPSRCYVYEDGEMGIQAALAAGMSAVNVITFQVFSP